MTKQFFASAARHIVRAANEGTISIGHAFATNLGAQSQDLDGTVTIALEGANAVAHEFGTLSSPARPVLSPALRARRRDVAHAIGNAINNDLRRK